MISPNNILEYKVGMDDKARFWIEPWVGNQPLKDQFNRLFRLETEKKKL